MGVGVLKEGHAGYKGGLGLCVADRLGPWGVEGLMEGTDYRGLGL